MIAVDGYFKVSAVAEFSGSEDSGQSNLFWGKRRKESSDEFGCIFRLACDELKQKSGSTHQTEGFVPQSSAPLIKMVFWP